MQRRTFFHLSALALLAGCGGGGSSAGDPPVLATRLIGEVFGTPEQVVQAELVTNAGYAGNVGALETSRAIAQSGRTNMLDFLFLLPVQPGLGPRLVSDAAQQLDRYIAQHRDLLQPGAYVYLIDEMFLVAVQAGAGQTAWQAELDALRAGVALVRERLPQARIGISLSAYASFDNDAVLPYMRQAIALVDWVATTAYWLGDATRIPALHAWTQGFPALAKSANARVQTWYIAQAFRDPGWDRQVFRDYMATELRLSDLYDAVLFFGWAHTSELPEQWAGRFFEPETRALYARFLPQRPA